MKQLTTVAQPNIRQLNIYRGETLIGWVRDGELTPELTICDLRQELAKFSFAELNFIQEDWVKMIS